MVYALALAGCILLLGLILTAMWLRDRQNEQSALAEETALRVALDDELAAFGAQTQHYAGSLSAAAIGQRRAANGPIPAAGPTGAGYIVDLNADFTAPRADAALGAIGAVARATAVARPALRGPIDDNTLSTASGEWAAARTGTVFAAQRAWMVAIVKRQDDLALAVAHPLDNVALAKLARAAGIAQVDVMAASGIGERDTAVLLPAAAGEKPAALVWRAARPGDEMFGTAAAMLLSFAGLFVALIVVYSRRVTSDLIEAEARAHDAATQDPMTGLPNRIIFARLLENEIARVKRSTEERGLAVLFIDIDRFKEINDSFGHSGGDQLIVAFAQRLNALIRAGGRAARLSGDEFAVLQTDVVGPRDAEILARRIVETMAEPFEINGGQIFVSASIGVALCPHDANEPNELMRRADLALYRAKNEGRNRFCFFEPRMGEQLQMRKAVEDDLRQAIDTGALLVQYQPVMSIDGGKMLGVEALVRWPHPVHGLISPDSFIALAEECGLILPLGEWVLRRALRDVQRWPGLKVAVNVSAIQFRQKEFVPMVERLLAETGVDPTKLELELTESVLIADADGAENAIIDLRALGVRLALDDFGTGYSSLIYLRRFAFDKIKIDKSFLQSMETTGESAIIVHSIVHLGRALGLTVTAEGVETKDQHRFLQALGCHELQGYLFSQPVGADDIDRHLRQLQQPTAAPDEARSVA
ncbi:MAG: EAL domain-containing protein [Hyphomicrobiales bacterium]|nr:EAL domain-containing protein [Hyphomicrobiales bacterium]